MNLFLVFYLFGEASSLVLSDSSLNTSYSLSSPPFRLTNQFSPVQQELLDLGTDGCSLPFPLDVSNAILWVGRAGGCSVQTKSRNCRTAGCTGMVFGGLTRIAGSASLLQWEDDNREGLAPTVEISTDDQISFENSLRGSFLVAHMDSSDPNPFLDFYRSPVAWFFRILFLLWLLLCIAMAIVALRGRIKSPANDEGRKKYGWIYFCLFSEIATSVVRLLYVTVDFLWAQGIFNNFWSKFLVTSTSGWSFATSCIIAVYWMQRLDDMLQIDTSLEADLSLALLHGFLRKSLSLTTRLPLIAGAMFLGTLLTCCDFLMILLEAVVYVNDLTAVYVLRGFIHLILVAIVAVFFTAIGTITLLRVRKVIRVIRYSFREFVTMCCCLIINGIGYLLTIASTISIIVSPRVRSAQIFGWAIILFFFGLQLVSTSQIVLLMRKK